MSTPWTITINGVDQSSRLQLASAEIEYQLGNPGTCEGVLIDTTTNPTSAYRPAPEQILSLSKSGEKFRGRLVDLQETALGDIDVGTRIEFAAIDYTRALNKRLFTGAYGQFKAVDITAATTAKAKLYSGNEHAAMKLETREKGLAIEERYSIQFIDPKSANHALTLATPTTGQHIFYLATNAAGVITTTAADIKALESSLVFYVSYVVDPETGILSNGSGLVGELTQTFLTGAEDPIVEVFNELGVQSISGNPGRVTTVRPHGLTSGNVVRLVDVSGVSPAAVNNTDYVVTVINTVQFTVPVTVTVDGIGGRILRMTQVGVIITDIAALLTSYGITLETLASPSPYIVPTEFTNVPYSEVLTTATGLAGWVYRLTHQKILQAFSIGTKIATFSLNGNNIIGGPTPRRNRLDYANQIIAKYGVSGTVIRRIDEYVANGIVTAWTTDTPYIAINLTLAYGYVVVNGITKPLGAYGVDVMTWTFDAAASVLHYSGTAASISGAIIHFPYSGDSQATVTVPDSAQITVMGGEIYEAEIDAGDVTREDAIAKATNDLTLLKETSLSISITTRAGFELPGSLVQLTIPERSLSGYWLIIGTLIRATEEREDDTQSNAREVYEYELVQTGPHTSWVDYLQLSGGNSGSGSITVSGGGGGGSGGGVGTGNVSGSGTIGTLTKWITAAGALGNSLIYESGSLVTVSGSLTVSATATIGGAVTAASLSTTANVTVGANLTVAGTADITGGVYNRSNWLMLNKAGTGWIAWGTRNVAGAEALLDLLYVGAISSQTLSTGVISAASLTTTGNIIAEGTIESRSAAYFRSGLWLLNKIGNGWLNFAERDVTGADVVYNLQYIKNISTSGTLTVGGAATLLAGLTVTGNVTATTLTSTGAATVGSTLSVSGSIVPTSTATWTVGTTSVRWLTIYGVNGNFSGVATVGGNLSVTGTIKSGTTGTAGRFELARSSDGVTVGLINLTGSSLNLDALGGDINILPGSVQAMVVKVGGNVGIGMTEPAQKLDVGGTVRSSYAPDPSYYTEMSALGGGAFITVGGYSTLYFKIGATTVLTLNATTSSLAGNLNLGQSRLLGVSDIAYIDLYNPGTGNLSLVNTSNSSAFGNIVFKTNSTEKVRIDVSGNVGIGTISPGAKLEVSEGTSGDQVRVGHSTNIYKIGRNTATGFLNFDGTQTGFVGYAFMGGNVGIGTASPAVKLDVIGQGRFSSNVVVGSSIATYSSTNVPIRINGVIGTSPNTYGFYDDSTKTPTANGTEAESFSSVHVIDTTASNFSVTNDYGFRYRATTKLGAGIITNAYGLYLETPTIGTNNYAIYSAGGPNYFGGLGSFGGSLSIVGSLATGTVSSNLIPTSTDLYDIGRYDKLWNQAFISTLNAIVFKESTATIFGGYSMISRQAGAFQAGVTATATSIDFGQTMTVGHWVLVRAHDMGGVVRREYLTVGTLVAGTVYNVTRDLAADFVTDPAWASGTPFLVLGTTGDGRIEMLAYDGKPRMLFVQMGAAFNNQNDRGVIGNLNGYYGYTTDNLGKDIHGAAFGDFTTTNVTVDPYYGFRIRLGTVNKFAVDGSGNLSLTGDLTMGTAGVFRAGASAFDAGAGWWMDFNGGTPRMRIGNPLGNQLVWNGTTLAITGIITATSGTIGGWNLETGSLYAGTGATRIMLSSNDATYFISAGNETASLAPFSVTRAGIVFASSGVIGGFGLTSYSITAGDGVTHVGMSSDGTRAFWSGANLFANAPFSVTSQGVLKATSGTVGGWTIGAASITGGNAVLESAGVGTFGTGEDTAIISAWNTTYRLWIGKTSDPATAPFSVTKLGAIKATSGTVGGWYLEAGSLYAGNGTTRIMLASTPTTYFISAGADDPALAPFSVTKTGSLKATAGTIGGFSITSAVLYAGDTSASRVGMSSDGTRAFWAGNEVFANAPFSVTSQGALKAVSGTVGGWIMETGVLYSGSGSTRIAVASNDPTYFIYAGSETPSTAPFRLTKTGIVTLGAGGSFNAGGVTLDSAGLYIASVANSTSYSNLNAIRWTTDTTYRTAIWRSDGTTLENYKYFNLDHILSADFGGSALQTTAKQTFTTGVNAGKYSQVKTRSTVNGAGCQWDTAVSHSWAVTPWSAGISLNSGNYDPTNGYNYPTSARFGVVNDTGGGIGGAHPSSPMYLTTGLIINSASCNFYVGGDYLPARLSVTSTQVSITTTLVVTGHITTGLNADGGIRYSGYNGYYSFITRNSGNTWRLSLLDADGDASNDAIGTDLITASYNGFVGIGTAIPGSMLHVKGWQATVAAFQSTTINGPLLRLMMSDNTVLGFIGMERGWTGGVGTDFIFTAEGAGRNFRFFVGGASTPIFHITGKGIGIGMTPGYQIELSADSAGKPSTSTWTIVSDASVKTNVTPMTGALDLIRAVKIHDFEFTGGGNTERGRRSIGPVANEIQALFPRSVRRRSDGLLDFNAHELFMATVAAVQTVDSELTTLRARVAVLEGRG